MRFAGLRFGAFVAIVLGAPAALMAAGDPRLADLGKLVIIASPALAGLALNAGLPRRTGERRWVWVALAAAITLCIAIGAVGAGLLAGVVRFDPAAGGAEIVAARAGGSALTSVLEELGWAGGGLGLAVAAFGRRWGVGVLGLVWAAWHLVPTFLKVGLFPELETAPPAMLAAFVAACLIYRALLTDLRDRAGTWLAAAAGHGAPNILLAGAMAGGLGGFEHLGAAWPFFPAPGGLVFPVLALAALLILRRVRPA